MDPVIKDNDPSHIWTKEEIIECGLCLEEEPDFERDEVNDIISVGAQDEYDADPDVLVDDANDFEDDNNSSIIHEKKEENVELVQEPVLERVIEPMLEQVIEPTVEPVLEPTVEPVQEPMLEQVIEPALEQVIEPESDIGLPFNIEKKEENEEKEEDEEKEEKGEPETNTVVNKLALDESIIEESAPKNIIVDENNLPFIDEEKEENPEKSVSTVELTVETSPEDPIVEEPLNIVVPIIVDNEDNVRSVAELADNHATSTRRDNATFLAPPARKFKWKDWFQSLWFWA